MMKGRLYTFLLISLCSIDVFSQAETQNPNSAAGIFWKVKGNAGTSAASNFIGTTDNQALVFRTNNTENARVSTNGNVSIGTTISTSGRLHNFLAASDATTTSGFYNQHQGSSTSTTYGIRSYNESSTNSTKYGLYNYTDESGTGGRYGIYNYVLMDPSTVAAGYGIRNFLQSQGSGIHYGFYNYLSQIGTGITYGIYNNNILAATSIANSYGEYTYMDYTSGSRYGSYKIMQSNATYDGAIYGDYNLLSGTGDGDANGYYNEINVTGTGVKYGIRNEFGDVQGTKFGMASYIPTGTSTGTIYGVYNEIYNNSASTRYGIYNYLLGGTGAMRGCYNALYPDAASTGTVYGVYSYVNDIGTGTHYGGYFSAYGAGNYGVYSTNTDAAGIAGYFYGNTQMRTAGRTYALYSDYTNDVVRVGSNVGNLYQNGSTIVGATVDYVADFDNGLADGTAVGIGSIEYFLDGTARTTINNEFDPTAHITYDLGYSTTTEAWDDVYADDFWNVSDIREKENVKNMDYGLSELLKMKTISYKLKNDPFKDPKIGLIAQDVLPLIPEAVKTHDYKVTDESNPAQFNRVELNRMGINYGTLVPVLIRSIQQQQQMIDQLRKENSEIRDLMKSKNR